MAPLPPPSDAPGPPPCDAPAPPADAKWPGATFELVGPTGWKSRLAGRKGPHQVTVRADQIVIEHAGRLREPLVIAPGGVAVAALDPGPETATGAVGRFPILRRLSKTSVVPREHGIEGWLWTSTGGSAMTQLGQEGEVPNLALVFLAPLEEEVVEQAFEPEFLGELAKRSPLGSPTVFGVLMRATKLEKAREAFAKVSLIRPLTDREVPPTQRRHLPDDVPANPEILRGEGKAQSGSVAPPGMG